MQNKTYWWIKLQENFFNSKEMKKLRRIAGGAVYTIIYLKLQLLGMKSGGKIFFDGVEETFAEEIALTIDEDAENVAATLLFLEKTGLASRVGENEIFLPEVEQNTGRETRWAGYKREERRRIAEEAAAAIEQKVDIVQQQSNDGPTEIDIEIEKEIEIERGRAGARTPAPAYTRAKTLDGSMQYFGEYCNVALTAEEVKKLQAELPDRWEEICERLSSYKKRTGKTYASDFATIRKWAKEDDEIALETIKQLRPKSNSFVDYDGRREYTPEEYAEIELAMRNKRAGEEEQ